MPPDSVREAIGEFRRYKGLAEKALAQVTDEDLFRTLDEESNSMAILLKHLAGNLRSRWTDFLTSDGEKPDRRRDAEFLVEPGDSREKLLARWEDGWRRLFETLESLTPEDMQKTVLVRGEPHSITLALDRSLAHCAYHAGQIVFLAKHFAGSNWKSLSIPRKKV